MDPKASVLPTTPQNSGVVTVVQGSVISPLLFVFSSTILGYALLVEDVTLAVVN